jgi:uncharacterized membrane protein YkoI
MFGFFSHSLRIKHRIRRLRGLRSNNLQPLAFQRVQAFFIWRCYTSSKEKMMIQLFSARRKGTLQSGALFAAFMLVFGGTVLSAQSHAKLTKQQAKAIATQKEPGSIQSGELEHENGRWIYSFDIKTGSQIHEVNVDAHTGAVVEDSVENPAAEAREKAQEAKHAKVSPK